MRTRSFLLLGTTFVFAFSVPAFADEPTPAPKPSASGSAAPPAPSATPSSTPSAAPTAAPEPATSDKPPPPKTPNRTDTVRLRNGGFHRGHVTEIVPEDHVTIVQLDGQTKTIPWADIDRVIIGGPPSARAGGTTATPPSTTTSPPSPPKPRSPFAGPLAKVHIAAPSRVILFRRPAGTSQWEIACESPCDERLPIGDDYKVTGNSIAASDEFKLQAPADGAVYLNVHASSAGKVLGGVLASVGALVGYIGLLVALANDSSFEKEERTNGLIALGIGSGMAVAGLVVFLLTGGTDVAQTREDGKSAALALPLKKLSSKPLDSYLRAPFEKSSAASASQNTGLLPPAAFPLVFTKQF